MVKLILLAPWPAERHPARRPRGRPGADRRPPRGRRRRARRPPRRRRSRGSRPCPARGAPRKEEVPPPPRPGKEPVAPIGEPAGLGRIDPPLAVEAIAVEVNAGTLDRLFHREPVADDVDDGLGGRAA